MSKILVTGSEGSLMQAVIPKLIKQGHVVYGADNLVRHGERTGRAGTDYEFFKVDLVDRPSVDSMMKSIKPDFVIQAAATIYGVGGFNKFCADMYKDISLHENTLRAAVANDVRRVIFTSSSMIYENCPQVVNLPVAEEMPNLYPAPYTDYGLSKFVGERASMAYWKQHKLEYTIWRPFNIFSKYEKSDETIGISHVFADFIKTIILNRTNVVPILGDGEQIRCFTHIDEIAQVISDFSFVDNTKNKVYNIGNPEPVTMKELAYKIHKIGNEEFGLEIPSLVFNHLPSYNNDVRVRIPDVSKIKEELGWETKIKLNDSIKECIGFLLNVEQN